MPPNWLIPNLWIINYIWVSTLDLNPLLSLAMSLNPAKRLLSPHNPATLLWSTSFTLTQVKFESWGVFSLILLSLLMVPVMANALRALKKNCCANPKQTYLNQHTLCLQALFQQSLAKSSPWIFSWASSKRSTQKKDALLCLKDQKNVWFQRMNLSPLVTSIETC